MTVWGWMCIFFWQAYVGWTKIPKDTQQCWNRMGTREATVLNHFPNVVSGGSQNSLTVLSTDPVWTSLNSSRWILPLMLSDMWNCLPLFGPLSNVRERETWIIMFWIWLDSIWRQRYNTWSSACRWWSWVADSKTRSKPNHPENRILFRPEFYLSFSQISQKPRGVWVGKHIWERSPKKNTFIFGRLS